nr:cubilin [Parasteatoda tepidariorum]
MMTDSWNLKLLIFCYIFLEFCMISTSEQSDPFLDRPRIVVQDGNLIFKSALNKNVSFSPSGQGIVQINNVDLSRLASAAKTVGSSQESSYASLIRKYAEQSETLESLTEQVNQMEENITLIYNRVNKFLGSGSDRISNRALRRAMAKVGVLTEKVNTLTQLLTQNECISNPCRNGGTCVDAYNGFICNCPSNWEGVTCETDVNECAVFAGTSFGCQNGATCINSHGGYSCVCPPNFHGIDCTEKHDDCGSASHYELCGHGTCVDEKRIQPGQPKYRCICDAGWKIPNGGLACTEDIDECSGADRKCSQNPLVTCINTQGSFHCGPCPAGFTGNGYHCNDINECDMYNGGCSMHPFVQCINTHGSSQCGSCPTGYVGNGRQCTFSGVCSINRGGCHPNATCIENTAITGTYRECRCPPGYGGDGVGLHGCYPLSGMSCANNPCQQGTCQMTSNSFHCLCFAGWYGTLCDRQEDPCFSQPCQNGGTCIRRAGSYICNCTEGYQGPTCAETRERCGGYLSGSNGTLTYPENGVHYNHKQDCAWVIRVSSGKVVNVKVNHFSLESGENCQYDFLQLNDGPTAASRVINRFCDDHLDGKNFTSSHNELYMWFHSDSSYASTGFSMEWSEVDPVCGAELNVSEYGSINSPGYPGPYPHNRTCLWLVKVPVGKRIQFHVCGAELNVSEYGSINSPGYPGPYPHNRTCLWLVKVPVGKRIQFHFATLKLESHENCSYDYLKIFDGASERDPLIGTYCTTVTPPPLTTSGHAATLLFHSDHSVQDTGFHIVYSSQSNVQGCGGTLTAPTGNLRSPNFPDVYENNLVCEWLIRIHPDNRLLLKFTDFHTESHNECNFDAVEVFAGTNDAAPLIGRYCGTTIPEEIFSDSHQLFIRFRTDTSLRYKGFRAEYKTICGGVYTEATGILKSPFFPDYYPARALCLYEIRLSPGYLINVTFHNMEIESHLDCRFDYLQVRDGEKEDSPLIGQLCGSLVPEPIISTFNFLWMKFESDGSVQNRGFYAVYNAIEIGCGGVMTETSGQISSPRHPDAYPHKTTCTWLLKATPGHVIRLTFTSFNLEMDTDCRFDYVLVEDTSSIQIGKYCGNRRPPILTSMDETLLVKFVTDASVARDGFTATYEFLNTEEECGGDFYQSSGVIRSPGFPNRYPHSAHCVWILHAPNQRQISLNVTSFVVEQHAGCRYDYLELRNGATGTSPLIGRYCGEEILKTVRSHSNSLRIEFKSDFSMSAPGFEIYFDSTATGCGGKLTSPRGTIMSPNYPQTYPINANCEWLIQVSEGSVISLHVVDIDIEEHRECRFDYLQVFDGNSENSKSLMRICNNQQNPGPISSSSNSLLVRFRSDVSQEAGGFHLAYETLCNTVLKKRRGVIESPNFPNTYPHNHNCSWTIEAPPGNNISIVFSHFTLEGSEDCEADYVEILEGQSVRSLGKFCGDQSELPGVIKTSSNKAIVRLITDRSISREGFRLEYHMKGCGGDIVNKNSGSITSPNYPNGYPFATVCNWHISYAPGDRVELTIHDIELEADPECTYDFVRVYGGEDENSPRLLNACRGSGDSQIVTSHGNKMTIQFASDHSIARRGFRATYRRLPPNITPGGPAGCGGLFSSDEGTILSPNYPETYNANDECVWLIRVDPNHLVLLEFYDFDLPTAANCTLGYVAIYDGGSSNSALLLKACGQKPEGEIASTSNQMLVRLVANGNNVGKGFRAHYKRGCGQRLLADNGGEITSMNYPDFSPGNVNCSWIIYTSDPGEKVILTVTNQQIPERDGCVHSSLIIMDGDLPDSPVLKEMCGSRSLLPIISQSNAMHVFMKNFGIFRATYGLSSMHCGGAFSSLQGTFGTPGYPNNYDMTMECIWTIQASAGNKVHLSFEVFSIEDSDYCNNDYVEIHENDAAGPLIGKYCGHRIPSNVTAARKLWIKFRSDDIGTDSGFLANYELIHGIQLSGNEGIIESPGYPDKIMTTRGNEYDWTIFVDSGLFVSLRFLAIGIVRITETNACSSKIKIFDGFDDTAPLLGEYCGYQIPEPLVSTSNTMSIKYSPAYDGSGFFRLQWTAVLDRGIVIDLPNVPAENLCWEELEIDASDQTPVRTISSPNYPENYPDEINCTYIIRAQHFEHVELNISELVLEAADRRCEYDTLEIYYLTNPNVNEWTLNSSLCGRHNSLLFASPTNVMKLVLLTDRFMNFKGFTSTAHVRCGTHLFGATGVIKSDYIYTGLNRSQHFNPIQCEYVIRVRPRRTVQLHFDTFNVPSDSVCSSNYILLRNGGSNASPYLGNGKYCGSTAPPNLESSSNQIYVQVVVNSLASGSPNFHIRYTEVSIGCGGRVFLTDEIRNVDIVSPNYPNPPTHDIECEWVIVSPSGTRMRMDFENEFHLSPNCVEGDQVEYVDIHDGGTELAPVLHRFCGHDQPSSVMSTGNAIFVRYVTGVDTPQAGFKSTIRIANCGGTISSMKSVITSPGYPMSYRDSEECEWFLKMKNGYHIVLKLDDMNTPRSNRENCTLTDYLEIRNYDSEGELLGLFCGNLDNVSTIIEVPGPQAYMKFKSNSANTGRGFSVTMTSDFNGCGARVENPSGVITSPNYPNLLSGSRECYWRIIAPEGRKIKITFDELNLPKDEATGVCISYIVMYNSTNWRTGGTSYICGNVVPAPISSSSGTLDIILWTHGLNAGQGFTLSYSTEEESDCGGALFPPTGIMATPNFTVETHTVIDCKWKIYNDHYENKTAVIRFDVLDIPGEVSHYCRNNVFYVLGDCGGALFPPTGIMATPNFTVETHTVIDCKWKIYNDHYENKTAVIRFDVLDIPGEVSHYCRNNVFYVLGDCGGRIVANSNSTISSPGYPNNYPTNMDCQWIIVPDGGETVVVFSDLRLENDCNKDYVIVRNGYHFNSPIIGKFCGTNAPAPIVASGSVLVVIFHSDEYGTAPGFSLTTGQFQSGCGGLIHLTSGTISSQNYPSRYKNNIECIWFIEYVPGYVIHLEFVGRFELEMDSNCEKDYLLIEEFKDDNTWTVRDKKCGSSTPEPITLKSRKARLTFRSNDRITGDGFSLKYSAVCGGNFTQSSGEIFSPNYPNSYANSLSCIYVIGKEGQYISLSFDDYFSLEVHDDCLFDNVSIAHGDDTNFTQGPYCGNQAPAPRSLAGPVILKFQTDSSYVAHGFKANYKILDCGATLSEPSGSISTPRNFKEYLPTMDCTWHIVAQPNHVIALRFTHFDIRATYKCLMEYVEIRDGNSTGPLIGRLCGKNSTVSVKSLGNMLTIKLYMKAEHGGISAHYYNTFGPDQGCGGTINAASGTIQSFDVDNNGLYEPNLDCNWFVTSDNPDKILQISFERFDIDDSSDGSCEFDYLELREDYVLGNLIGRFCGSNLPTTIVTATSKVNILFHTDGEINKPGFKMNFQSLDSPCGSSVLQSEQAPKFLMSPNFPSQYPVNLQCKWVFIRNDSHVPIPEKGNYKMKVHIKFIDFDIPCGGDYLNFQMYPSDRRLRDFPSYVSRFIS